jgi:hypothetical protein
MNLSLYSAATGMEAQQLNLNTIANNLANVNTPGFKRSKIEFQDLLYQKPTRAAGTDSGGGNLVPTGIEVGNGSRVAATSKVFNTRILSPRNCNGNGAGPSVMPLNRKSCVTLTTLPIASTSAEIYNFKHALPSPHSMSPPTDGPFRRTGAIPYRQNFA